MSEVFPFTGTPSHDWPALCEIWQQSPYVLSGEIGATWETPVQHQVCLDFAARYPDAKPFLLEQLLDPDPRIAAYAFKILIRLDVAAEEIPLQAVERKESIGVQIHSRIRSRIIGDFIADFFDEYDFARLKDEDQRTKEWQEGPLADYKQAKAEEKQNPGTAS